MPREQDLILQLHQTSLQTQVLCTAVPGVPGAISSWHHLCMWWH